MFNDSGNLQKGLLYIAIIVSLILLEYSPIKALNQINDVSQQYDLQFDTTSLWLQVFGLVILHIAILGVIWGIPDTNKLALREKEEAAAEETGACSLITIDPETKKKLDLLNKPRYTPPYILEQEDKKKKEKKE